MIKNSPLHGFIFLVLLLGFLCSCVSRLEEKPIRQPETSGTHGLAIQKSAPPRPALTLPRGDEHAATFFQQKLNDPAGKPDACKEYILTFTQDKVLWNWARQNC